MENKEKICCSKTETKFKKGIVSGILYGLIPHSFCIAFVLFSVIGAVAFTAFLKKFLMIPYFIHLLFLVSLILATISAFIYLKKMECLCASGVKSKWKYLTTLYSVTLLVNFLMFFVVLPALANLDAGDEIKSEKSQEQAVSLAEISLEVKIPCPGHASLIIDELKKNPAVKWVKYDLPENFEIKYDPKRTTPEKITASEVFKTYPAIIKN